MKIVGIAGVVLFLIGGLVLLIGLIVCVNTWTSDYATSTCEQAERDRAKFAEAKETCGSTTSDCYRQSTIGLVSESDCEAKTAFMNRQMLMGAIPGVIGFLVATVGLFMGIGGFVMARRRKRTVAASAV